MVCNVKKKAGIKYSIHKSFHKELISGAAKNQCMSSTDYGYQTFMYQVHDNEKQTGYESSLSWIEVKLIYDQLATIAC